MADFLEQIEQLREQEPRDVVAMATLVGARGGSPRPLGAKLFVNEDGQLLGSVSIGGCVDARVVEHGQRLLKSGGWERVTVTVDDAEALELGLACGAEFDLLIEPIPLHVHHPTVSAYEEAARISRSGKEAYVVTRMTGEEPRREIQRAAPDEAPSRDTFVERVAPTEVLVVIGTTDVARALARFASLLSMRVVLIDGRGAETSNAFLHGLDVRVGMPSELVRPLLRSGSYIVLAVHDYKYELPVLREALRAPVQYVGMLSGRKRAESVRALLREDGLTEQEIGRLHAPIGLDIGGRQPEEIALSIAAQLVAVREGKPIGARR